MPRRSEHWLAETRERIEGAALWLILNRGFHGFTLRDLLLEAWVSVGCFYRYFEDKDEVLRSAAGWFYGGEHGAKMGLLSSSAPAMEWLQDLVADEVRDRARPDGVERGRLEVLAWGEMLTRRDLVPLYERELPALLASIHQVIRRGQRNGEIDRGLFAPSAAMAVTGLIMMLSLMRALGFRFTRARMGAVLARMIGSLAPRQGARNPRRR